MAQRTSWSGCDTGNQQAAIAGRLERALCADPDQPPSGRVLHQLVVRPQPALRKAATAFCARAPMSASLKSGLNNSEPKPKPAAPALRHSDMLPAPTPPTA